MLAVLPNGAICDRGYSVSMRFALYCLPLALVAVLAAAISLIGQARTRVCIRVGRLVQTFAVAREQALKAYHKVCRCA